MTRRGDPPITPRCTILTERHDNHRTFRLAVQPLIDPAESLATDELFRRQLASTPADGSGVLRVYTLDGELVSLGRYHAVRGDLSRAQLGRLHRRHSGGRNLPVGEGFVGLSIVLPHRSALVSDEPLALAPHQVLNRCVRGILEGLKGAGIPAFYPGRDLITVDRCAIAMVSFDVGFDGGLVFEAVIAVSRDFSVQIDPSDCARVPRLSAGDVTGLNEQLGVDLALSDVAEILARGYARQFGLLFETFDPASGELHREVVNLARGRFDKERWTTTPMVSAELDHHAATDVMLGVLEAHVSLGAGGVLNDVLLAGDIIANAGAIEALRHNLRGCRADRQSIDAVIAETLAPPENFILGVPDTGTITTTIMHAIEKP